MSPLDNQPKPTEGLATGSSEPHTLNQNASANPKTALLLALQRELPDLDESRLARLLKSIEGLLTSIAGERHLSNALVDPSSGQQLTRAYYSSPKGVLVVSPALDGGIVVSSPYGHGHHFTSAKGDIYIRSGGGESQYCSPNSKVHSDYIDPLSPQNFILGVPELCKLPSKEQAEPYIEMIQDSENPLGVRVDAAGQLSKLGTNPEATRTINTLIDELQNVLHNRHENTNKRVSAAEALKAIRTPQAMKALIETISSNEIGEPPELMKAVVDALRPFGAEAKDALPALEKILQAEGTQISLQWVAVGMLGCLKDPKAMPILIKCLGSWNDYLQNDAERALVAIGPQGIPGIVSAFNGQDSRVRLRLVSVLSQIGHKDAIEPLQARLGFLGLGLFSAEPDSGIREYIRKTIDRLRSRN